MGQRHYSNIHQGGGGHPEGEDHGGEEGWLVSYADMMTLLVGFFVILQSFSQVDQEKFEKIKKSVNDKFGGKYEEPYKDLTENIKAEVDKLGLTDSVSIKTDESGVSISFLGTAFFDIGSVDLKEASKELVKKITPLIVKQEDNFHVTIEGHTDNIPLNNGLVYRNNFELSSIRACRVLDSFIERGMSKNKVTAVGYGEARPEFPNEDEQGKSIPENQAKNRRVVIKLSKNDPNTL